MPPWEKYRQQRDVQRVAIVRPAQADAEARNALAEQAKQEYMAGSKVAAGGPEALRGARPGIGTAIATAATLPLAGPAVGALGRAGGAALRFAATPGGGAAIGAVEGARRGPVEALTGAATGAIGGPLARHGMLKFMARLKGAQGAAAKEALAAARAKGVAAAEKTIRGLGMTPVREFAAAQAARASAAKAGGAVASEGQNMAQNILRWRTEHKLSDGQITDALRQVYGIAKPQAKEILKLLGS